jgi:nucleotide-binding universal stress UspA family protein
MADDSMNSMISAVQDFRAARRKAALEQIMSRLQSRSPDLLSYDEVRQKLHAVESSGQTLREIPLDAIVGSVGRYSDFTRSFLPRTDSGRGRWARIKSIAEGLTGLPPIEVYQVGEAYFVKDGNHRVSVSREIGSSSIQAYVTKVQTEVPLDPDVQPDDLIIKAEYADFLEKTGFKRFRPQAELQLTAAGQYPKFEAHLQAHKQFLESELNHPVPLHEAAADWYDSRYLPVVNEIRERGILRDFPDRTEADLYLWVSEHRDSLEARFEQEIPPGVAAENLAASYSPRPERIFKRLSSRLLDVLTPDELESGPRPGFWRKQRVQPRPSDVLFPQLLVALSAGDEGWHALDQALILARRERAQIHGLRVVSQEDQVIRDETLRIQEEFDRRLSSSSMKGVLHVDVGIISRRICERAQWADLIVLNLAHPPSPEPIGRLGSGLRTLLRRCTRPVLAVPQNVTPLGPAMLAFDDSPKAWEALYVATYLAGHWGIPISVLTVEEEGLDSKTVRDKAQTYLDGHGIKADYLIESGEVAEVMLKLARERALDWLLLGGYSASPVVEVVVGSTVEALLRRAKIPMLICR